MSTALQCSSCSAPLPIGVSDGLCSSCLTALLAGARRRLPRAKNGKWPRRFGEYELLEKLGLGGMGIVYKARQRKLDRVVALKMIRSQRFDGEYEIQRFHSETEAVARLDHPHIVPLYEVGEHRGRHFFSMLLVESGSLMTHMPRLRKVQRKSAQIMATVARAIHYAHQHGILHRDLKPANILLDAEDQPYVTDFGLAKKADDESSLTQTGAVLGTPSYMSPEQAAGKLGKSSPAADVYSLGAILYELLTGQPPFAAETALATLRQLQEEAPRRPGLVDRNINQDLEAICLKCLEKDPQRRYATAEALALDLERFLRDEPIDARPVGHFEVLVKWARREPLLAGVITAAALLLLTATIVSMSMAIKLHGLLPPPPNNPSVVVLMDARARRAVYDDDIFAKEGTNADVISEQLRGLRLNLMKEALSFDWNRTDAIIAMHPELVIIHKSAIFHATNAMNNGAFLFKYPEPPDNVRTPEWQRLYDSADERVIEFIVSVGRSCPRTKFIVYSRGTDGVWPNADYRDTWVNNVVRRCPTLQNRIKAMLIEKVPDAKGELRATFKDKVNQDKMLQLVQESLDIKNP